MLTLEEIQTTNGMGCELCRLREWLEGPDVAAHIQAMDDLEQRAASGGLWQLCHCCQIALSLWDSGGVDDLPRA